LITFATDAFTDIAETLETFVHITANKMSFFQSMIRLFEAPRTEPVTFQIFLLFMRMFHEYDKVLLLLLVLDWGV